MYINSKVEFVRQVQVNIRVDHFTGLHVQVRLDTRAIRRNGRRGEWQTDGRWTGHQCL